MRTIKSDLRRRAFARRDLVSPNEARTAASEVARRGLAVARENLAGGATVAAYWPIRSELHTRPLFDALTDAGFRTALPVTRETRTPMIFRLWSPDDDTVRGVLGNSEPSDNAPTVVPALVFAPLAAFDAQGGRIGHGSGHYDTTMQALRLHGPVLFVGLAFDCQEVETVPLEPHDIRLDMILTETRSLRTGAH